MCKKHTVQYKSTCTMNVGLLNQQLETSILSSMARKHQTLKSRQKPSSLETWPRHANVASVGSSTPRWPRSVSTAVPLSRAAPAPSVAAPTTSTAQSASSVALPFPRQPQSGSTSDHTAEVGVCACVRVCVQCTCYIPYIMKFVRASNSCVSVQAIWARTN